MIFSMNVKEVVRSLKASIPITKLLAADADIQEYLLCCASQFSYLLGAHLPVPQVMNVKEQTME